MCDPSRVLRALTIVSACTSAAGIVSLKCLPSRPPGANICPGSTTVTTEDECRDLGYCCYEPPPMAGGVGTCYAMPIFPFEGLTCDSLTFTTPDCSCDTVINGATVAIDTGDIENSLICSRCATISSEQRDDSVLGWSLEMRGAATIREYTAAIESVAFLQYAAYAKRDDDCGHPHAIRYNFGPARFRPELDNHFYGMADPLGADVEQCPNVVGDACTWSYAQRYCADPARDILGLVGYLPTHPDPQEYRYAARSPRELGWVGRADADVEGEWRWVTGPEGCPDAYDPAAADPFLRSGCDLALENIDRSFNPCYGEGCGKGQLVGIQRGPPYVPASFRTAPRQMAWSESAFPHDDRATADTALTGQDYGLADPTEQRDAPHRSRADRTPVFVCEWGGVGTLCMALESVSQRALLTTTPGCPPLDECVRDCTTCERGACDGRNPPQTCSDPDRTAESVGDWVCTCAAVGYTGKAVARAAECVPTDYYDECEELCGTCENRVCSDFQQECVDPMPSQASTRDWLCRCPAPVGLHNDTSGGPAPCVFNECTDGRKQAVCDTGTPAQACDDPDILTLDDWTCSCPDGYGGGSATARPATCTLDECDAMCLTCANDVCPMGQTCVDADQDAASTADWECRCDAPTTGVQRAAPAECALDECEASCPTCEDNICSVQLPQQACLDAFTSPASLSDWSCRCSPPYAGAAVGEPASCFIDECTASCNTCEEGECDSARPRQRCEDPSPDPRSLSDWKCVCAAPYSGDEVGAHADCRLDECTAACDTCESDACTNATPPQDCTDPNTERDSTGDWVCTCRAPFAGRRVAAPGRCDIDECSETCATCENGRCSTASPAQTCNDPSPFGDTLADWECLCTPPSQGNATGMRAQCTLDECTAVCDTCERDVCADAGGQYCVDANTSTAARRDWVCECEAPATGRRTGAAAVCVLNECTTTCDTCAGSTCTDAMQACADVDASPQGTDNWRCLCPAPYTTMGGMRSPADCVLDECGNTPCASCAGSTCSDAGQDCRDPDMTQGALGDWVCTCRAPFMGNATAALATCTVDECEAVCGGCANDTCRDAAQLCSDVMLETLGDWECRCPPPAMGTPATTRATVCRVDECVATGADVCASARQTCEDNDPDTPDTWRCICAPPSTGNRATGVAACTLDECDGTVTCDTCAQGTCEDAGQSCTDPNTDGDARSDWVCTCPPPAMGNATAAKAMCTLDECAAPVAGCRTCAGDTCSAARQGCRDPDTTVAATSDWVCECAAPSSGTATAAVAVCALDECTASCASCENDACGVVGQACRDGDTAPASLGDWFCDCMPPLRGTQPTAPAACALDECSEACPTCASGACASAALAQSCADPDTAPTALSDWTCSCPAPATGTQVAGPADCVLDECGVRRASSVCTDAGQRCKDTDTDALSIDDWVCMCTTGMGQATRKPAVCEVDECTTSACTASPQPTPCPFDVCGSAGQACSDPQLATTGDWKCMCADPLVGSAVGGPSACELDECMHLCDACTGGSCSGCGTTAPNACEAGGQACDDPDWSTRSLGDWVCSCPAPSSVTRVAGAADCAMPAREECVEDGGADACAAAGQVCEDPDTSAMSRGDWRCLCAAPLRGSAAGRPADNITDCAADPTPMPTTAVPAATDAPAPLAPRQTPLPTPTPTDAPAPIGGATPQPLTGVPVPVPEATRVPPTTATPAPERVDECTVSPAACAAVPGCAAAAYDGECEAAAGGGGLQVCEDPTPTAASLGDWLCRCLRNDARAKGRRVLGCGGGTVEPTAAPRRPPAATSTPPTPTPAPVVDTEAPRDDEAATAAPPQPGADDMAQSVVGPTTAAVGVASVFAGGAAAASAMQLAAIAASCNLDGQPVDLPWFFHPTGADVYGSQHLGAVVMNVAIVLLAAALALAVAVIFRSCVTCISQADSFGFTRFPSAPLIVTIFLFQAIALCSASVVMYPPAASPFGVAPLLGASAFALIVCAVPYKVSRAIRHGVPDDAVYAVDPLTVGRTYVIFVIGAGEWVSTDATHHFVWRWRCALHPWHQHRVWFCVADLVSSGALGWLAAIRPGTWAGCGHVKVLQLLVCAVMLGATLRHYPHHRPRDNLIRCGVNAFLVAGLASMAAGYYLEDPASPFFTIGSRMYMVVSFTLMAKAACDVMTEAYVLLSGRRRRLQGDAFNGIFYDPKHTETAVFADLLPRVTTSLTTLPASTPTPPPLRERRSSPGGIGGAGTATSVEMEEYLDAESRVAGADGDAASSASESSATDPTRDMKLLMSPSAGHSSMNQLLHASKHASHADSLLDMVPSTTGASTAASPLATPLALPASPPGSASGLRLSRPFNGSSPALGLLSLGAASRGRGRPPPTPMRITDDPPDPSPAALGSPVGGGGPDGSPMLTCRDRSSAFIDAPAPTSPLRRAAASGALPTLAKRAASQPTMRRSRGGQAAAQNGSPLAGDGAGAAWGTDI